MLNYERFIERHERQQILASVPGTPHSVSSRPATAIEQAREPKQMHRVVRATKQLWVALKKDQPAVIRVLILKRGALPDTADEAGRTPAWHCAWRGLTQALDMLMACGADPNVGDADGDTPLAAAARRGVPHIVEELLNHGARCDGANDDGQSPLWHAANYGHVGAARLLVPASDIEAADVHGRTPLHAACAASRDKAADLLLDVGADAGAADENGRTCLHVAGAAGDAALVIKMIAKTLEHRGAQGAEALLEREDRYGRTALWEAAKVGAADVVEALLDAGATKDTPAFSGRTPAEIADLHDHRDLARSIRLRVVPVKRPPTPVVESPAPAEGRPSTAGDTTSRPGLLSECSAANVVSAKPDLGLPELDVAKAKAGVRIFERLPDA